MPSPFAIAQLARIVGRADVLARLGLPADAPLPAALTDAQREATRALAAERAPQIAEALLVEATALDDIQDARAAVAYLDERLAFLAPLIPDDARDAIRARYLAVAAAWGDGA